MPQSQGPTIFFSVGEPSGDLHGANLIRQLQEQCPGIQAVGYGGPKMAGVGCQLHADLTALAVMWFARVLAHLHTFLGLIGRADRYFRQHKPDAVVLIDYPGFNWWIARRAKARGIPVFYYSPPQIWAWARWRVKKMRRFVDHVLCGLPFEEAWLRRHGCNATFVGHPFFDEVRRYPYDERFIEEHRGRPGPLVVILPGSRTQEVTHNLRWFLKAAAVIHEKVPGAYFALASFEQHQADIARPLVEQSGLPIEICVGKTPELMRLADCAMSVSGSVSLELLYHTTPTVILYWITPLAYLVQSFFRKVKYITLVNLLATDALEEKGAGEAGIRGQGSGVRGQGPVASGQWSVAGAKPQAADRKSDIPNPQSPNPQSPIPKSPNPQIPKSSPPNPRPDEALFPEYLTYEDKSAEIAGHIVGWLNDPASRAARVEALSALEAASGARRGVAPSRRLYPRCVEQAAAVTPPGVVSVLFAEPPRTEYDLTFGLFGFPVRVHPMFWLMTLMLGYNLGNPASVLIWVVAVFLSILVHELGHAAVMRAYGFRPWIVLYGMGGLTCRDSRDDFNSGFYARKYDWLEQILISVAGPAAGFLLAAVLVAAIFAAGYGRHCGFHDPFGLLPYVRLPCAVGGVVEPRFLCQCFLGIGESVAHLSVGRRTDRPRSFSEVQHSRRHSPIVGAVDVRRRRDGLVCDEPAGLDRRFFLRLSCLFEFHRDAILRRSQSVVRIVARGGSSDRAKKFFRKYQ